MNMLRVWRYEVAGRLRVLRGNVRAQGVWFFPGRRQDLFLYVKSRDHGRIDGKGRAGWGY